jgi:hypothetical protein
MQPSLSILQQNACTSERGGIWLHAEGGKHGRVRSIGLLSVAASSYLYDLVHAELQKKYLFAWSSNYLLVILFTVFRHVLLHRQLISCLTKQLYAALSFGN